MKHKNNIISRFPRKNAPKRDELGRSQRKICLEEFENGKNWAEVAREKVVKPETCRRYYQHWKKLPKGFEFSYKMAADTLKDPESREKFAMAMAKQLRLTPEEVEQILLRPWGLRSLIMAKFGLKKLSPTRSESETAALIRMERIIRDSGLAPEEFVQKMNFLVELGQGAERQKKPQKLKKDELKK